MKRIFVTLVALGTLFSVRVSANELLFRLGPQFGILAEVQDHVIHGAVRRYVFLIPEGHLEYQIVRRWFATASFHYIYLLGNRSDSMDVLAPTAGIKIVSFEDTPLEGDFFDRTRWWLNIEAGFYRTRSHLNAIIPRGGQTDFGFNFSAGFDAFIKKHWAAGFQAKMHYVNYNPDDYVLATFGPLLTFRF